MIVREPTLFDATRNSLNLLFFQVHMPVFFYIDPEFADDPAMENVDDITLSYTFFEAKPGLEIPLPGFMQKK